MAVCDFIPVEKIPVLVVPEIGVEECEGELRFRVKNQFGVIRIAGHGWAAKCTWRCRGSAEALAAAGLLELTWLPGLPGNAKISQRVIFNGKPEPYRGPRTPRRFANSICVVRLGKNYEVEIPATPEQAVVLGDVRERYWQAREQRWAREQQDKLMAKMKTEKLNWSIAEVRDRICAYAVAGRSLVDSVLEDSGCHLDAVSKRLLEERFAALEKALREAQIARPVTDLPENVVRFTR